ncbi:MAG: hypothetical protein COY22_00605 [Candidatus Tagabacteria bacterium CG_4_10_14_0_2_um_filter_40_13]|nr:MAG: hypothetical protein COY22_00605 [Candidatus Tagabacteria bacterium CG_4_10_14_0_2_um_filter_40_13]
MNTNYIFYKMSDKLKALPVIIVRLFRAAGGLVELLLFIRLFLKFTAANPDAPVVGLLYQLSDSLVSPFSPIFSDIYIFNRLIEVPAISAMAGYAILMLIISQLWKLFTRPYHR